jgi:hypothetical protein
MHSPTKLKKALGLVITGFTRPGPFGSFGNTSSALKCCRAYGGKCPQQATIITRKCPPPFYYVLGPFEMTEILCSLRGEKVFVDVRESIPGRITTCDMRHATCTRVLKSEKQA